MWRNGACATISRKQRSDRSRMVLRIPAAARRAPPSPPATGAHPEYQQINPQHSLRIVKDHANGVTMAGTDPADAMTQVNAIEPARPLHWPDMHSKSHGVALGERHHFGPRLHPRPLLG